MEVNDERLNQRNRALCVHIFSSYLETWIWHLENNPSKCHPDLWALTRHSSWPRARSFHPASSESRAELVYVMQHMQILWCGPLRHLFCECLLNRSKALAGFLSVIYWIVLKHFNRILSTRCSDFTTQAFGPLEGGRRTSRLNDVNINVLQPAFAIQHWNYRLYVLCKIILEISLAVWLQSISILLLFDWE